MVGQKASFPFLDAATHKKPISFEMRVLMGQQYFCRLLPVRCQYQRAIRSQHAAQLFQPRVLLCYGQVR